MKNSMNKMKKLFSVLILSLLLGMSAQICLAEENSTEDSTIQNKNSMVQMDDSKIHGSIELVGYFERINGQEWNLNLYYELTDKIKIGITENIHQYQLWQNKNNEYRTDIILIYRFHEQFEFYLVPFNTTNSPYFKVKFEF